MTWRDIWRRQEEERSAKFKELSEYQPIGRMGQPKEVWLLPKGLMLRYNAPCPVLPVPVFRLARPGVPPYKASGLPGLVLRLLGLRVPSYKAACPVLQGFVLPSYKVLRFVLQGVCSRLTRPLVPISPGLVLPLTWSSVPVLPGPVFRLLKLRVPSYKAGWMQVASLILYLCSDEASFVTGGTKLLVAHLPI